MTAVTVDAPFVSLPLKVLHESPTNPRQRFEEKPMKDLVESVRAHGVLQPILVRDRQQPGDEPGSRYEIVAGARRYRAAREAGLLEIPCIVRELTDKQTLEVQFVENLQRADLHPLDEGYGYKRLHDEHGYTVDHLAAKLGKSVGYVYGRMQLAKLPVKAQTLFFDGAIDLSHAQLVARIPVPELADKAAAAIAKGDHSGVPMTYRSAVDYVRRNFQCNLKDAPFPTQDRDLVPDAGPCGKCPKRTGNQKDLFGGPADGVGADVCTDPGCFELKTKRHFAVQKEEILAAGGKVIDGAKAKEFVYGDKLVDPDSKCYQDPQARAWKVLTKGQALQTVLLKGTDGQALIRWDRAAAVKAAIENGHTFLRPVKAASSSGTRSDAKVLDDHRKWIEKRRIEGLGRDKARSLIVTKAEALTPDEVIRIIAKSTFPAPSICKQRGWKGTVDAGKFAGSAPVKALQGFVLEGLWETGCDNLAGLLGIDLKAITKQVAAEEKAKAKAAEKAKAAKPTARAKALGKALAAAKKPKAKAAKKAKPAKAKGAPAMDETKFDVHHGASSRRGSVVAGD